jgi:transcriptional regulator with XRE-family HTH domain
MAGTLTRERALLAYEVGRRRVATSLTRDQLAKKAGVNVRQVTEIESGVRDPSFTTVVRIAKALNLSALDELLGPLPLASVVEQ